MSNIVNALVGLSSSRIPNLSPMRLCSVCLEPISAARLMAAPKSVVCVPCLKNSGDVAPIRRLDDGASQTYFQNSHVFELQLLRAANHVPDAQTLSDVTEAPGYDSSREDRAKAFNPPEEELKEIPTDDCQSDSD